MVGGWEEDDRGIVLCINVLCRVDLLWLSVWFLGCCVFLFWRNIYLFSTLMKYDFV